MERVLIVDRAEFTDLFAQLVLKLGSQSAVARAIGIDQAQISRYVAGRFGRSVTRRVFDQMCLFFRSARAPGFTLPMLFSCLLTESARRALDEHELWRRVQSFPFHVPEHAVAGKPKTDHFDWSHIQGQLEIREALEGHLFDEIQLIQTHPAYRGRIRAFERLMKRRGHLDSRIKLGVWQVLYPIIAYIETHGVERSWQEMDAAGELPKYLNAAIRCQELILNRTPDLRRAQEMTAE